MNRLCVILSLTFNLAFGQDQSLTGNYTLGNNYVTISDSSLEFKTGYGCCIIMVLYGYGDYKIHNDSIYVMTTQHPNGRTSTYQTLGDLTASDQIKFKITDKDQPVQFGTVKLIDKSTNKIITGADSDFSGFALLDSLPTEHLQNIVVEISSFGYDHFEIPLSAIIGKSISVNLLDYVVLRDTQVAFKLLVDSNSTKLIGPFFPLTKAEKKEMKKEKRKRKGQMMVHTWPWRWRFKDTHVVTPTTYVRQ